VREQVLHYIRERQLLKAGDRVGVAVSGGADSVALLRVLLELRGELGIVLQVSHFHHQLRGEESDADERFVAQLAAAHGLPFFSGRGDVRQHAAADKLSLEHAARELRYRWFGELAAGQKLDAIATAHHADDQAETVLMKFLRGAGTRGLAGIHPVHTGHGMRIVRPLLATPRAEIERYLHQLNQPWCEDHSNRDTQHTRNRIRHELLPVLEREYNPNLRQLLSETAEIALAEENYWRNSTSTLAARWHQRVRGLRLREGTSDGFLSSGIALQRRTLKYFLEWHGVAVDFHHLEAVRRCALGNGATVSLGAGWQARRDRDWLELLAPTSAFQKREGPGHWLYILPVPGSCPLPEAALALRAEVLPEAAAALQPPGTLLRADRLPGELTVRNWCPGDRFRPAHSGSEKKLKELFADKRIPAEHRPLWPVVLSGDQIVWVRGFPVAHELAWTPGSGDALRIEISPPE